MTNVMGGRVRGPRRTMPRMRHLTNKLVVVAACCALLYGAGYAGVQEVFAPEMAALLVAAAVSMLGGVVPRRLRVPLLLVDAVAACAVPAAIPALLPLACYDLTCMVWGRWPARWSAVPAAGALALVLLAWAGSLPVVPAVLGAAFTALAGPLAERTVAGEVGQAELLALRDDLQEVVLRLSAKNRELDEARAWQGEAAKLAERARIAREIHDGVGHMLTRGVLQVGALRAVHRGEAVVEELAAVEATLQEALGAVRTSVHDLHDAAADLRVVLAQMADGYPAGKVTLRVEADGTPDARTVGCLVSVAREALSNAARHGRARHVEVLVTEFPALWQLKVVDDGEGAGERPGSGRGLGLVSMRERVEELGGSFSAGPDEQGGFAVFASVPKRG